MIIEKNVIDPDQWDNIDRLFAQLEPQDGKSTAGVKIRHLKQSTIYQDPHIAATVFTKNFIGFLQEKLHGFTMGNARFSKYCKGDFYDWHVDQQEAGKFITSLSYTIFLNNPSDYSGGELQIDTENGIKTIKLNRGDMILYPSSYLHKVKKIKKGERKVCIGWISPTIPNMKDIFTLDRIKSVFEKVSDVYDSLEECKEKDELGTVMNYMHYIRIQFKRKCYNNL